MDLIDSHCHLPRMEAKGLLPDLLARAAAAGVGEMITIGTGMKDWASSQRLASTHPGKIHWTAGIHPCDVGEEWEDQIKTLPTYFATDPLPVALGEIGLDYFHLPKFPDEAAEAKALQARAFRAQLELAYQFDCPVVIHSRGAFHECVEMIDQSGVDWRKVVFHCFVEGAAEMRILNEKGGRGSFTGILTYKNRSADPLRAALLAQPLEMLMLETDSPFLTPEPHRGEPNQPAFVRHVAECAASLLEMDLETLAARTSDNVRAFFQLNG